ncbi:asparagine synthase (glutamine-hydrolyzing) [Neptunicella marina]|uniref:asparagine synthase (glutamine-hydrolyzing) n=1 Tax=Neptunicella marina TaxID=2125989 RepID=A0A8J6IQ94_9ALTE|nr:asparagine synthase (glutamine-hydrolyzing) [Neptunicella marina]MBC3765016.1 asparagine synthase (glutamine-hydrolyzing) [Neptunicella marina]
MCGICGIVAVPEKIGINDSSAIEKMMQAMFHRGPDGKGVFRSDGILLGHQRLAVIDIEHGKQPMYSADKRFALVFNGEIYNYLELRQSLTQSGIVFSTFSDTEVLLQLLIKEGKHALNKLNGMFAFFFVDTFTGKWLAARDHFGVKPFYYANVNGKFIFASEIKALLKHPEIQAEVNQQGIGQYLTFQFLLGQQTLFANINKLEPAHFIEGELSGAQVPARYWDLDFTVNEQVSEQLLHEKLTSLLEDSVKLQLRSDVPLGTYLSGGLDSSAVTAIAAGYLDAPIKSFTGKFTEYHGFDESEYADDVARYCGANCQHIEPSQKDFITDFNQIIYMLDEPVAGPGVFPQYRVSAEAAKQVKVILGGQGGDEIFGGYARYLVGYLEQALKGAIFETQEEGKHLVSLESIVPNLPLLKQYVPMLNQFWKEGLFESMDKRYFRLTNRAPDIQSLLSNDTLALLDQYHPFSQFESIFNGANTHSYINKMTNFDLQTLLPALLQVEDRVSMAVSLESRVPLLDKRIAELVASVPPGMKFKGGKTKALLKEVLKNKVPQNVLARKDKMGFPVPLAQWSLQGPVAEFIQDVFSSQRARQRGIFSQSALQNIGRLGGVGARQLWGMLCLEMWHQIYIDS